MVMKTKQFVFGPFKLDVANSLLLHHDTPIPLTPKAFDTVFNITFATVQNRDELFARLYLPRDYFSVDHNRWGHDMSHAHENHSATIAKSRGFGRAG
jgi:hypothetical protein